MLQAIEAEISPNGQVTLLEPVHLEHPTRAVVTILASENKVAGSRGRGSMLLELLDSPDFASAPPGDPDRIEREIAANRDAWGD